MIWIGIACGGLACLALGWLLGRCFNRQDASEFVFHQDYFSGLRYLIDEEPDKAVDVFIRILEVNADTIETHMALGGLFRRRGEVSRAIKIHRNLIARPHLGKEQRINALMALAEDYLAAGLFDRAEKVLLQLRKDVGNEKRCLEHLLRLYQRQKDWPQAIQVAVLLAESKPELVGVIAHLYCECAEQALPHDLPSAVKFCKLAEKYQSNARTQAIKARLLVKQGEARKAVKAWMQLVAKHPYLLAVVIDDLRAACLAQNGDPTVFFTYLRGLLAELPVEDAALPLCDAIMGSWGVERALDFVVLVLKQQGLYLDAYMAWVDGFSDWSVSDALALWQQHTNSWVHTPMDRVSYRCQECGLTARTYHWCCPGCERWSTYRRDHHPQARALVKA